MQLNFLMTYALTMLYGAYGPNKGGKTLTFANSLNYSST